MCFQSKLWSFAFELDTPLQDMQPVGPELACAICRDDLGDDIFIEVKASALRGKNIFNMSLPEMKFAEAQGNNLHIYRIAGVGTDSPSLTRLINPIQLSKMKLINLCVQM